MKANTYVTIRLSWAIVMVLVAGLFTSLAGIGFTVAAQNRADRRWCNLLQLVDRPVPTPPGLSAEEKQRRELAAAELHELRISLGCRIT